MLNKLFKGVKGRNNRFVMYYGTKEYMTQLASNNSQSECNLIMNLWEKK